MKPRVTYPRTVVLPKDCEQLWRSVKANDPSQSFNGWITRAIREYYGTMDMNGDAILDNPDDEAVG